MSSLRPVWLIAAAFLVVQVLIVWFAANGPFVDEALYAVAGMRVLEGKGLADGYLTWFNGSPFVWPVLAGLGHHLAGLAGSRSVAVILSVVTLVAFARTAAALFGESAAAWGAAAISVNGLFMALAHFAVYDVPALTAVAVAMWCIARSSRTDAPIWLVGAAIAFAGAVICKYGYLLMVAPLVGLVVSTHPAERLGRRLAIFLSVAGVLLGAYFLASFGSLVPTSTAAYLEQTFRRTRGHIAVLQIVFGLVPFLLASAGALVAWRARRRGLAATCLLALALYPLFHLWTANFVSGQKHVVPGFLFGYLLAGVALQRLWQTRSRVTLTALVTLLVVWGAVQWYWQEYSWTDTRALTRSLAQSMKRGERIVADSAWIYALSLYPRGLIDSPFDVIDLHHQPSFERVDVCRVAWLVGNLEDAERIREAMRRCGHQPVLSTATLQHYIDTTRLRWDAQTVVVALFRLPDP